MSETCKMCTWSSRQFGLFCLAPNGQGFVEPDFTCASWGESRETPPLVDMLAEALRDIVLRACYEGTWWIGTNTVKTAKLALARYQKEVGDA